MLNRIHSAHLNSKRLTTVESLLWGGSGSSSDQDHLVLRTLVQLQPVPFCRIWLSVLIVGVIYIILFKDPTFILMDPDHK